MFEPDVLIFFEHIDGRLLGATSLPTQKRHAVAGTGRHADAIGEGDVGIHQVVEHPDGEHHAHTPAFQNQSSRCIHKHKHLWQLLAPLANKCCISVYKSCAKVYYSARNVVTLRGRIITKNCVLCSFLVPLMQSAAAACANSSVAASFSSRQQRQPLQLPEQPLQVPSG